MSATAVDDRTAWLRTMLEIRLFEDKVQELFMQGRIQGTTHLCQGQEAVSVGAVGALEERDYLTITYRGHGHALARGMPMEAAFGELMGLTSGCCSGVGGSMHLTDFSRNLIGAFAIIGPSFSVAVGAAMSAKLRGSDAVAMAFCGDGATNIGTFHEALNMASVWKAPAVFVIENNLYGEYSPLRDTTPLDDLADRAKAHAMPGVVVDGQDVALVREAASAAIDRARAGGGPTLIEAKTYRFRGHSRTDPAKYRVEGELEQWKLRDPIDLLGAQLTADGVLSDDALRALRDELQLAVDAAADHAAQAGVLSLEETKTYVYAS
ncbi:MAG TPA: thiamine pyrophosphate-dependent dehydrogenase E1 component subunit alpha [Gaiellaceae bacterium]|nr:thiamine pyrophosphate-dependent dehydrogenase E1 component subunit alpha [Gaiellaceae bacterium]